MRTADAKCRKAPTFGIECSLDTISGIDEEGRDEARFSMPGGH